MFSEDPVEFTPTCCQTFLCFWVRPWANTTLDLILGLSAPRPRTSTRCWGTWATTPKGRRGWKSSWEKCKLAIQSSPTGTAQEVREDDMAELAKVSHVPEGDCLTLLGAPIQIGPEADREWELIRQTCWIALHMRRKLLRVKGRAAEKLRMLSMCVCLSSAEPGSGSAFGGTARTAITVQSSAVCRCAAALCNCRRIATNPFRPFSKARHHGAKTFTER